MKRPAQRWLEDKDIEPRPKRARVTKLGKYVNLLNHPTRVFVVGRSQMGKTTLSVQVIQERFSGMDRYIVICPSFRSQPAYASIRHLFKKNDIYENPKKDTFDKILKDVIAFNRWATDQGLDAPKTFILFDDVAGTKLVHGNGNGSFATFSTQVTHWNCTLMVLSQDPKRIDPLFRKNTENLIVFPSEAKYDMDWLETSFNSKVFSKHHDFQEIVYQAWSAGKDKEEVGQHHLFIHSAPRRLSRFFSDFDKEIVTKQ